MRNCDGEAQVGELGRRSTGWGTEKAKHRLGNWEGEAHVEELEGEAQVEELRLRSAG